MTNLTIQEEAEQMPALLAALITDASPSAIAARVADEVEALLLLALHVGNKEECGEDVSRVGHRVELLEAMFHLVYAAARVESWPIAKFEPVMVMHYAAAMAIFGPQGASVVQSIIEHAVARAGAPGNADLIVGRALDESAHALRFAKASAEDAALKALSAISASTRKGQ